MPKIHSELCFCGDHISVSPHIRSGIQSTTDYICTLQTMMAAKEPEVIDIPDEEEEGDDDWQDVGPINIREVRSQITLHDTLRSSLHLSKLLHM